jgi:hypothetical protein
MKGQFPIAMNFLFLIDEHEQQEKVNPKAFKISYVQRSPRMNEFHLINAGTFKRGCKISATNIYMEVLAEIENENQRNGNRRQEPKTCSHGIRSIRSDQEHHGRMLRWSLFCNLEVGYQLVSFGALS